MKNLSNPLENYVRAVKEKKVVVGKYVKLAIKRYNELKKNKNYYLDLEDVHRIIGVTESLKIIKNGRKEKFKLYDFQIFILGNLVGWKEKKTDIRLYQEAYITLGRQNGKSLILAALAIFYSGFDIFMNSRIFCAATKKEQARIVWEDIADFIKFDKILDKKYYKIQDHISTVTSRKTGSKIKALSKDTKNMDGFDSALAICDEYHAHPTNQMYKLLKDGQVNVDNALTVAITTAGFNLNSPCYKHEEYCINILNGIVKQDRIFIFIAKPDKDDDISKLNTWLKASPYLMYNLDYSLKETKINKYKETLKEVTFKGGEDLLNFMTKQLNIWVSSNDNDYLNKEKIKKVCEKVDYQKVYGKNAIIGIDLSSGGDLTSVSFIITNYKENKPLILSHSFVPREKVEENSKKSLAPFNLWINRGLMTVTNGVKTDYKSILKYLKEFIEKHNLNIIDVGYDPYGAGAWLTDLLEIVPDATSITQSAKNLGSSVEDFKLTLEGNELIIDKENELLLWSMGNAKVGYNSFGEPKVMKQKVGEKIDPIISVIDAWYLYVNNQNEIVDVNKEFDDWLENNW